MRQIDKRVFIAHIIVLGFFYIYFSKLYPVIPYDGDDWYFAGAMRKPWPMWGVFNPTKVLPEVLEPLGGYVAAFLVYPITGDYIGSMTITQAFVISVFITSFGLMYYRFLIERFRIKHGLAISLEYILLLSFFALFAFWGDHCKYFGFYTPNLNVIFNYPIPGLLNASVVLFMARYEDFGTRFREMCSAKKGVFFLAVYFSIFSSIQMSIILAAYCSLMIVTGTRSVILEEKSKTAYFREMYLYFVIILLFFVSLIYEINGVRAKIVSDQSSFFSQPFKAVLFQLADLIKEMNISFLVFSLVFFLIAVIIVIQKCNVQHQCNDYIVLRTVCGMLCITLVYLTLLYAKTGGDYMGTPYGTWSLLCEGLLLSNLSLAVVFSRYGSIKPLIPSILVIMFIITINQNFRHNLYDRDYSTCKALDEYIIDQIVSADKAGLCNVDVKVPNEHTDGNWPHPYNMANWMQNTLYAHHLINKRIKITFVPDDSVNEMFYTYDRDQMEPFSDLEVH